MGSRLSIMEREVVDLLATWGATAEPAVRELFDVLSGARDRGEVRLLARLLSRPEILGGPELRAELEALHEQAAGGVANAAFNTRLRQGLQQAEAAVGEHLDAERRRVRESVASWGPLLGPKRLTGCLEQLWLTEAADGLNGRLDAVDTLAGARERFDSARVERVTEIRGSLADQDEELRGPVLAAIDGDDPLGIAAAWGRLRGGQAVQDRARRVDAFREAASRLDASCEQARALVGDPARSLDSASREMLLSALDGAGRYRGSSGGGDDEAPPEALMQGLERWNVTLHGMLDSLAADPDADAAVRRAAAEAVGRKVKEAGGEDEGAAGRSVTQQTGETLSRVVEHVGDGGRPFYDAIQQGWDLVALLRQDASRRVDAAGAPLRKSAQQLSTLLEQSASVLPAGQVVAARLRLDRIDSVVAAGEAPAIDRLKTEIDQDHESFAHLVDQDKKMRRSKHAAERVRLRGRVERLAPATTGKDGRRLEQLERELEDAPAGDLTDIGAELDLLAGSIEGQARLDACRLVEVAGSDGEAGERAAAVRQALEGDDLGALAQASAELEPIVGGRLRRRSMLRWIAVVLAAVVVFVGLHAARAMRSQPHDYHLTFTAAAGIPDDIEIVLFRDGGEEEARQAYDPESGVSFSLQPGVYHVFVDEAFTGRRIRVPQDDSRVVDIPLPRPGTAEE